MPIKYAARGISAQFRTPSELVNEDGVTLKSINGNDVFVQNNLSNSIEIGQQYNAVTGGCIANDTLYANTLTLNESGRYIISDTINAYDISGDSAQKKWLGVVKTFIADPPIAFTSYCIMDTDNNTELIVSSDQVIVEDKMYTKGEQYRSIECIDIPYAFISK